MTSTERCRSALWSVTVTIFQHPYNGRKGSSSMLDRLLKLTFEIQSRLELKQEYRTYQCLRKNLIG